MSEILASKRPSLILLCGFAMALVGCQAPTEKGSARDESVFQSEVKTHPSQGKVRVVDGALAKLVTTRGGVYANLTTTELKPGHVYTMWWVVINNPAACRTSPCKPPDVLKRTATTNSDVGYADGIVAGRNGTGAFNSYLPGGKLRQGWFGNGLQNPTGAEIHLVINDHGPLIPQMAPTMLSSYRGGCRDEGLPKVFPATAKADGKPGPNRCALIQSATIQQ